MVIIQAFQATSSYCFILGIVFHRYLFLKKSRSVKSDTTWTQHVWSSWTALRGHVSRHSLTAERRTDSVSGQCGGLLTPGAGGRSSPHWPVFVTPPPGRPPRRRRAACWSRALHKKVCQVKSRWTEARAAVHDAQCESEELRGRLLYSRWVEVQCLSLLFMFCHFNSCFNWESHQPLSHCSVSNLLSAHSALLSHRQTS